MNFPVPLLPTPPLSEGQVGSAGLPGAKLSLVWSKIERAPDTVQVQTVKKSCLGFFFSSSFLGAVKVWVKFDSVEDKGISQTAKLVCLSLH